jgi:hypothetical protein
VTTTTAVNVTADPMGGAQHRAELYRCLTRSKWQDVGFIGNECSIDAGWLARREIANPIRGRRLAVNNVGLVADSGERWAPLANPLDFMTDGEWSNRRPDLRAAARRRAPIVHLAARIMAERITRKPPSLQSRVVVCLHPVAACSILSMPRKPLILCLMLFSPYKHTVATIRDGVTAINDHIDPSIWLLVTASHTEMPPPLASHPRIQMVGQLPLSKLRHRWAQSCAICLPTGIESFGFPLAEARAHSQPVIARDTPQNKEIAGPALCGFAMGAADSLQHATRLAPTTTVAPDPAPFDPDAYFDWMLGSPR